MTNFKKEIPFNNLPLLPPKVELETKKVLLKTISASRALAQLNGAMINLPNSRLFLDTIHLQEAKASSEIENIITTNDDLYKSVVAEKKNENPATKEVLSYKDALWSGLERLESRPFITTNLCIEIIFKLPYTKRQFLIDSGLGTPKTVGNYLISLEEKGYLTSVKVGKEKLYLNHKLMEILENE